MDYNSNKLTKTIKEIIKDYEPLLESLLDTNFKHLTNDEIINIHLGVLKEGEPKGIQDSHAFNDVVKSAKRADSNILGIYVISATYMFSIAYGQVFQDGNKRTALISGLEFLNKNGIDVTNDGNDKVLYDLLIGYMGHDPSYDVYRGGRVLSKKFPNKNNLSEGGEQTSVSSIISNYQELLNKLSK